MTTLRGDAIRTATSDPATKGNPSWGMRTIPAGNGNTVSALVLSFRVQVALNPGDYKNQVKITTTIPGEVDQGDPVALVVDPRPSLTLTAAATAGQVMTGGMATYVISVANVGSAVAKRVAVSVSLPPGFLYSTTTNYEGNGLRVATVDPPGNSLLPLWSSWDIPGASNGVPGLVRLTFQARVLSAVTPGLYNLTAAVTSAADVPPQTVGNIAPVSVGKGTKLPITMTVAATGPYASQSGTVTYVVTLENDSNDAAQAVIVPAGGFNGATLVIIFTAKINGASLGPHANVVSANSSNAQITGGSDQSPVIVTAG